jgi:DNA-directed RNA polymerase subunit N (RpoN/RPB10)
MEEENYMLSYRWYPTLCRTCGEPLSCYAKEYENLILNVGMSIEEALNSLFLMNPCTRSEMMNPTIKFFNLQNIEVVEGKKLPSEVNLVKKQEINTIKPLFPSCVPLTKNGAVVETMDRNIELFDSDEELNSSEEEDIPNKIPEKTILLPPSLKKKQDTSKDIVLEALYENLDEGGLVIEAGAGEFMKYPTHIGVPVINESPFVQEETAYIGAGKFLPILSGRTYLAR